MGPRRTKIDKVLGGYLTFTVACALHSPRPIQNQLLRRTHTGPLYAQSPGKLSLVLMSQGRP